MLLLALDTSTSAITVAVHDGDRVLAHESTLDARAHAELLAPSLLRVLEQAGATPADVTHVVAGQGPGPFTGLRVGLVSARVFGWARGLPVHGVCSLDALALQAVDAAVDGTAGEGTPRLLVATDARRKEVYWAAYDVVGGLPVRVGGPEVGRAAELPEGLRVLPCAGRGPGLYPDALPNATGHLDVDAAALAELAVRRLAAGQPFDAPDPLYLRRPDAVPSQAKPVTPAAAR